ncbi:uncharacterized protein LOC142972852 [Anticarsia gemmatalis]|uniref:uncharacterized protein LOC142972852 n=1 Tax=Anticarsia gemmatalis TaxID=129554 RepID=UPI003F7632FB
MDLQGSLIDTNLSVYPTNNLLNYLKTLAIKDDAPSNIIKLVKGKDYEPKQKTNKEEKESSPIHLNSQDIENLNKIRATVKIEEDVVEDSEDIPEEEIKEKGSKDEAHDDSDKKSNKKDDPKDESKKAKEDSNEKTKKSKEDCNEKSKKEEVLHLTTSDIDWLYNHLQKLRSKGDKNVPYLHTLLEGAEIGIPDNSVIKRNPILEARCVKLRAQQEAREYRKMTKSVDNVRMRFPEDSINYQLKQVNRQLIAIGQFIISIFAGFLFGFKGVEWMIGQLDFGFRLLLGVMCALIIALAEIYFLAKKLNEEMNVPETVQLGGPPKFADQQTHYVPKVSDKAIEKDHQD